METVIERKVKTPKKSKKSNDYYNQYKEERNEYRKQRDQALRELEELKSSIEQGNTPDKSNIPKFLFNDKASNTELYNYLKINPSASKFIFKKYKDNQEFIKELCDPENPIHIPEVMENLREIYTLEEKKNEMALIQADINKLNMSKVNLTGEIDKLREELKNRAKELDLIEENIDRMSKEENELQKKSGNHRSDKGIELLTKNINDVIELFKTIEGKWKEEIKISPTILHLKLEKIYIQNISELHQRLVDLMEYMKTEDFLSDEYLNEYQKKMMENFRKIKEEMQKKEEEEKQKTENSVNAFQLHNPEKIIEKSINAISLLDTRLNGLHDPITGEISISATEAKVIKGEIEESLKILENMQSMVLNSKRRKK